MGFPEMLAELQRKHGLRSLRPKERRILAALGVEAGELDAYDLMAIEHRAQELGVGEGTDGGIPLGADDGRRPPAQEACRFEHDMPAAE